MKKMLLAATLLMGVSTVPVFAADPTPAPAATTPAMPAPKPKMMHKAKAMPMKAMPMKAGMMKPAREKSTDDLNQQQLDMHKS